MVETVRTPDGPRKRTICYLGELNNSADDANVTLQFVSGQAFSAGQTKSLAFVFQIPSNLPPGTYTIDVGVFSGDWAKLYTWGYRVATFSVQ